MEYFEINILVYTTIVSLLSFILMIVDKMSAKKRKQRIRESTFFVLALLGGSAAVYFAMGLFNHKTQKNGFVFGIPLIFAVQCVALYLVNKYVF
ncbi:MAG: DUF1294 domain-containing protein [Ruminococcaceae bacterium]|nr:DUF1294 domain-containing protein [Oscillospiraceae bacterium]